MVGRLLLLLTALFSAFSCSRNEGKQIGDTSETKISTGLLELSITDSTLKMFEGIDIGSLYNDKASKSSSDSLMKEYLKLIDTLTIDNKRFFRLEGDYILSEVELRSLLAYKLEELRRSELQNLDNKLVIRSIEGRKEIISHFKKIVYGINYASFENKAQYIQMVKDCEAAAKSWEGITGVKFSYDSSLDKSSAIGLVKTGVTFMVQRSGFRRRGVYAKAPFPSFTDRLLLIYDDFFSQKIYPSEGLVRHELGHVLGFLHEHQNPACIKAECRMIIDPDEGTALGGCDRSSVMHLVCPNEKAKSLMFSKVDSCHAQEVYPM